MGGFVAAFTQIQGNDTALRKEAEKHLTEAKASQPRSTAEHLFLAESTKVRQPVREQVAVCLGCPVKSVGVVLQQERDIRRQDSCVGRYQQQEAAAKPATSRAHERRSEPRLPKHEVCIDGDGSVRFSEFLQYHQSFAAWWIDGIAPSKEAQESPLMCLADSPSVQIQQLPSHDKQRLLTQGESQQMRTSWVPQPLADVAASVHHGTVTAMAVDAEEAIPFQQARWRRLPSAWQLQALLSEQWQLDAICEILQEIHREIQARHIQAGRP